jgi:hypothetical protein
MRCGLILLAVVAAAGLASSANAADLPVLGTTTSVECRFGPKQAPRQGTTFCTQVTVTISGGACADAESRLYFQSEVASAREYQGNAVRGGLNGVSISGTYADVVKPRSKLISDSGPHATSFGFFVADLSCGA